MLQNDGTVTILSNGLSAISSTEGVVSYDFSGQVRIIFKSLCGINKFMIRLKIESDNIFPEIAE
jgi:hypothetical protein